ncbi:putative xylanase/chitin deacetylase [Belliella baltica DSM 15883]|uniref:Putative xylanase/chitin deacetylase n=1 Tax=Belliella baltica (strain DSM 15883 / CIP 108006 / LMG 21964 / BA134) TaxID=866536 RepID=I3Z5G8_BELBD|nr:polysaccharide deacetylase family protein [Belliella baltica]AFL84486.1 putative xylanase/chitin deacetylase [Belliella baltica DSM 15883]
MVIHHVPTFIPRLFKHFTWHKDRSEKKVYLTFDDGPVPGVTDFVLNELERFEMKATFFMVGDNVKKNPELAKAVRDRGHAIGNHTFHHVNGYKTPDQLYLKEVADCQSILEEVLEVKTNVFRPPYGRITKSQYNSLKSQHEIIMWDVLSGDYDLRQTSEKCLHKSIKYTQNGSVIVFHDQIKTERVIKEVLPSYLQFVHKSGFETATLI